ncbi:MAG: PQQ-binding-like beta-propeller repeat protein [Candidatus Bathyarchaeota archaeon]|nr:PQQ-binding-like beta-propeller repeat protein [Candidatus Bathyarchaeota archaeon]
MQFSRSKTTIIAIALFLMLAITVSIVALPNASAQQSIKTFPFIGATPNPVGVNQEVLFHVGITTPLFSQEMGWEGLSIIIKGPDGTTETISNIRTDSTGATGRNWVPEEAGNYTVQTHFPEQATTPTKVAGTFFTGVFPEGTVFLEGNSTELTVVVQEEPIVIYPEHPLPTEYWTRPIDGQQREWYTVSASWLEASTFYEPNNLYAPYNDDAPETAHVLWARVMTQGGLVGGALGETYLEGLGYHSFEMGDAYEPKFANRIIMAGKLYYDRYASPDIYHEIVCVDLHTGEELWSRTLLDNRTIAFGQLMYWDTYDYHGVYDYLWVTIGSTYHAFDPTTGDWMYTIRNVPSGTRVMGPKGEILVYSVNLNDGYMTLWNSTNIPALYASNVIGSMGWGQWKAMGRTVGATDLHNVTFAGDPINPGFLPTPYSGYVWNVSIPTDLPGSIGGFLSVNGFTDDRILVTSYDRTEVSSAAINIDPENGAIGRVIFRNTWNAPSEWEEGNLWVTLEAITPNGENGVFVIRTAEDQKYYGFSTDNGEHLWTTSESEYYLNYYGISREHPPIIAYDKMYSTGVSGIVYCYDVHTGERLWTYEATDPYSEILWTNNWWLYPTFATDGKVYFGHQEHSPIDPRPRGGPFICLNATTGEEIWRANGLVRQSLWGGRAIIGDSIIATQDTYSQRIYAIGKGPSAMTVTAAPKVSVEGGSVLVEGMVTDVSPGTNDAALTMRFPNGVPAVSDADMSDWMLYVYKQFPRPSDVVGVEVVMSVLDPNGNSYVVGTTTSNDNGYFGSAFTPEVPGLYKITATFAGSGAYYGTYAETFINVEGAPSPTPIPTPEPESTADIYLLPATIGIIITVVVATIVIVLMLRRR